MRHPIDVLLEALHTDPAEETTWLALADALEEADQPDRADLLRLTRRLRTLSEGDGRTAVERRAQDLLAAGVPPCVPLRENTLGMVLALIPAGTFVMGSPDSEADREANKGPRHEVEITRPFYLAVHPVTQEQYQRIMGGNPSRFKSVPGEDTRLFPAENLSWKDAVKFCKRLSALPEEKSLGRTYRLPTEAEWEYSCRGGASSPFHFGNTLSSTQANFDGDYPYGGAATGPYLQRTCKVGSYKPNAFGLYDMHGNVWEWCADWYGGDYYAGSSRKDPTGPATGTRRVLRGGSWVNHGHVCHAAQRGRFEPDYRGNYAGFRVVLILPQG